MDFLRRTSLKNRSRCQVLIFIASICAASIAAADGPPPFLRRPDIHGDRIVFTSEGDLWLASVAAGSARRITTHAGVETNARFSPDGKMLAFNAQYDGGRLNIPNYANWVEGAWIIEGPGVEPDITVEQDPNAVLEGRDPQLDRAIAYLKEKIAAQPVSRPTPPPFPNKAWRK